MFPDSAEIQAANKKDKSNPKLKALSVAAVVVMICLVAAVIILFVKYRSAVSNIVPASITEQAKLPIYLPRKLPGNYKIDPGSFTYSEADKVLIFQAKDGVSSNLAFSEQAKPNDFDYSQFYKTEFEDPKTLSDVPFPSVWNKTSSGRVTLSIVTDDTWIIMTTTAPLGDDDMQRVAQNIRKH